MYYFLIIEMKKLSKAYIVKLKNGAIENKFQSRK